MNKGIGALIFGLIALVGGLVFVAILVKNKLSKEKEFEEGTEDDDNFDLTVDDEEFEHFFGDNDDEMFPEDKIADDDNGEIQVEVLTEEEPIVSEDFETSVANDDDDNSSDLFESLNETDFPKAETSAAELDDELPKADTSISDIDDDDLMGITDDDVENEEEQL